MFLKFGRVGGVLRAILDARLCDIIVFMACYALVRVWSLCPHC